jgi:hypothetical protein
VSRGGKETWRDKLKGITLTLLFLPVLLPIILIWFVAFAISRVMLNLLIRLLWMPRGKRALVIYSDSTIWAEYFRSEIIPALCNKALVLNWSHRKRWSPLSLKVRVFRSFSGEREFNPMVMVFYPFRGVKRFGFYGPFQDWKKGNIEPVETMKGNLLDALNLSQQTDFPSTIR